MTDELVRSFDEVQIAHDTFLALILGEVDIHFRPEDLVKATAAADVLCWMLGHEHNESFAHTLKSVRERLLAAGYVLLENTDRN